MGNAMRKSLFVAFLTGVLFGGFALAVTLRFGTVQASSILKPSVPEVTVTFEAHPYDVPPTYSIDRYTGENVMTQAGYHVENESVVVTIKNQRFTPYTDTEAGKSITLFYAIRAKGHFEQSWMDLGDVVPSDSEYTTSSYAYGGSEGPEILRYVPTGGKVDFQVEARIGYYTDDMENCRRIFTGETSGWSNTQTLTFGESQTPTPSPATTPTPMSSPEPQQTLQLEAIAGVAIVALLLGAGLGFLLYLTKRK